MTKKSIFFFFFIVLLNSCNRGKALKTELYTETHSQDFEGRIEYRLKYIPNTRKKIDTISLKKEFGERSTFIVKQGAIKQFNDFDQMAVQLYFPKENRLYFTNRKHPDTLYFYRCDKMANKDFKFEIVKNADTIAGYICNKLIYKDEFGQIDYYFAPKLKMNPKYTKNYSFLNKNRLNEIMKSVYLRQDFRTSDFTVITEAIKVEKIKIAESEFAKPKHKIVIEK